MTLATIAAFLKGPGLALVVVGWVAKIAATVLALRWWRRRKGETV